MVYQKNSYKNRRFTWKRQKKKKSTYTFTCRCDCLYQHFFLVHMHLVWSKALKHFRFRVSVLSKNPPQLFSEEPGLKPEPLQKHHPGAVTHSQIETIPTATTNRFWGSRQCQLNSILWKRSAGKACQKKQTTRRQHSKFQYWVIKLRKTLFLHFEDRALNEILLMGETFFFTSSLLHYYPPKKISFLVCKLSCCFMYFLLDKKNKTRPWIEENASKRWGLLLMLTPSLNWQIPTQMITALNSLISLYLSTSQLSGFLCSR